jgi:hypothetical protein
LVGKGFRGIEPAHADALLDRLVTYREMPPDAEGEGPCDWAPLLDPAVYADADAALLRIARQVHGRQQVAFLNEAAALYAQFRGRIDQLARALAGDARRVQEAWLAENPVRRIRDNAQLPASRAPQGRAAVNGSPRGAPESDAPPRTDEALPRAGGAPYAFETKEAFATQAPQAPQAPQARARIVMKRASRGLQLDAEVIRKVLALNTAYAVTIVSAEDYIGDRVSFDEVELQFHLEHYISECPARLNYLVVNQEFLSEWDVRALTAGDAVALCKTAHADQFLRREFGVAPLQIGFTTPELSGPAEGPAKDARLVAHLAGASGMKGTAAVLRAWAEHGGLAAAATLFVTRQPPVFARAPDDLAYWDGLRPARGATYRGIGELERHGNMYLARRALDEAEFATIARSAAVHLCPSAVEGFGHSINIGRAAGAVVIATDAPPMNELVDARCGIVVAAAAGPPMAGINPTQRKHYPGAVASLATYVVPPAALMAAITAALALGGPDRARLGAAARARYESGRDAFTAALTAVVAGETAARSA